MPGDEDAIIAGQIDGPVGDILCKTPRLSGSVSAKYEISLLTVPSSWSPWPLPYRPLLNIWGRDTACVDAVDAHAERRNLHRRDLPRWINAALALL